MKKQYPLLILTECEECKKEFPHNHVPFDYTKNNELQIKVDNVPNYIYWGGHCGTMNDNEVQTHHCGFLCKKCFVELIEIKKFYHCECGCGG